jgi:4-amino-4-deoxy-L-arabinose transferase-like glycosyltransferase
MSLLDHFFGYFEMNRYTLGFVCFLVALSLIKFLKIPLVLNRKQVFLGILALGLVLRISWIGFSSHTTMFEWREGLMETDIANIHATEITKGTWFHDSDGSPTARRPIGYPIFLGLVYSIFGASLRVAWVAHLLLYLAGSYFLYRIAELIFSKTVGLWTMFFYALYPVSIYSVNMITDENLFLPLWYGGLLLLFRHIQDRPVRGSLIAYGLIFGYATMTRTHVIFMPLVVALAFFLMKKSWKQILVSFFTVLMLMQAVNLPWVIRNYKAWGHPLLYTASSSYIYSRVNSNATPEGGGHIPKKGEPGYSQEIDEAIASGNPARVNRACSRAMMRWIIAHPAAFVDLGLKRGLIFMGWDKKGVWPIWLQYYDGSFDPGRPLSERRRHYLEEAAYMAYYILFFTFLFAIFFLIRQRTRLAISVQSSLWVLGCIFLLWFCEQMIIYPDRKYRFPLEPLMIMVASVFVDYLVRSFYMTRRKVPPSGVSSTAH